MTAALRQLLAGSIDYAGTFPPARLSFSETVERYAAYRNGSNAWLLGRLVCGLADLPKLPDLHRNAPPSPWPISAIVGHPKGTALNFDFLRNDIAALQDFDARSRNIARVDSIELRLPSDLAGDGPMRTSLAGFFADLREALLRTGLAPLQVFVETPLHGDWHQRLREVTEALSISNRPGTPPNRSVEFAFKLRTGGLDAASIPAVEQIAAVISTCAERRLRWKATAGLHHPVSTWDNTLHCRTHGFVPLFIAAAMAASSEIHGSSENLSQQLFRELLAESDPRAFHFDEDGIQWRQFHVTAADIQHARATTLQSFGSCSFDEPCNGLDAFLECADTAASHAD